MIALLVALYVAGHPVPGKLRPCVYSRHGHIVVTDCIKRSSVDDNVWAFETSWGEYLECPKCNGDFEHDFPSAVVECVPRCVKIDPNIGWCAGRAVRVPRSFTTCKGEPTS